MKTYIKTTLASVLTLAFMVPVATAAQAGTNSDDIVVVSESAMEQWQTSATNKLNRNLVRSERQRGRTITSGIVQVSFALGADGRPANVELQSNTADRTAQRVAMAAVRSLGDISDVPVTNPGSAQFLANVIFADTYAEHDELVQSLAQSERARLAAGSGGDDYIVLGG